jgi:hypothetical protein
MNWSKNVYTFMLGAIIVLSGCMGAGTTDGQDADDTEATTVINNYYWNNTTTEVITEIPEMIAIGGITDDSLGYSYFEFINTTPGEMIQIHEANVGSNPASTIMEIMTNCSTANFQTGVAGIGTLEEAYYPGYPTSSGPYYLPGSHTSCTHELKIRAITGTMVGESITASWSLVYSIVPVTVG